MTKVIDKLIAKKLATGSANNIDFTPKKYGSIKSGGKRNIVNLERAVIVESHGRPIARKKFVVTICIDKNIADENVARRAKFAKSLYNKSSAPPNIFTNKNGKGSIINIATQAHIKAILTE